MRVTSKGQVTIPAEIRDKFGFVPDTEVEFVVKGKTVFLRKAKAKGVRGTKIVDHMRGRATVKMSTEEIMRLTRRER